MTPPGRVIASMPQDIPKIIHQTWKTKQLPAEYAAYHESVLSGHPHWECRVWSDVQNRRLIAQHYSWFLPTYDSYRHSIERVDAVRYFILYHYGGVYLDLDMECLKPLDPLFESDTVHLGLLANPTIRDTIVGNAFMAAPRRHPFFLFVCKRLAHEVKRDVTFADVFSNTGPAMLTRRVAAFRSMFAIKIIGLDHVCDRVALNENPTTCGKSLEAIRRGQLLYLIHHHTNSWNVQHLPPKFVPGDFVLFLWHDIDGGDIDYVEYSRDEHFEIFKKTRNQSKAIGFNFNGFIKSSDGKLTKQSGATSWLKPGMLPWVCIKRSALAQLPNLEGQLAESPFGPADS